MKKRKEKRGKRQQADTVDLKIIDEDKLMVQQMTIESKNALVQKIDEEYQLVQRLKKQK